MYIYNVTINIDHSHEKEWLEWMQAHHIPDMLATGKFSEAKMCQVMADGDSGGVTYSVQYTTESREMLQHYYRENADELRRKTIRKFGNRLVAFRTELKVVNHVQHFINS